MSLAFSTVSQCDDEGGAREAEDDVRLAPKSDGKSGRKNGCCPGLVEFVIYNCFGICSVQESGTTVSERVVLSRFIVDLSLGRCA